MQNQFGNYQIEGVLGRDELGTTFAAHDETVGTRVVIKFLTVPTSIPDNRALDIANRFTRRLKAASIIKHAALPVIYEVGGSGRNRFGVIEYAEGRPLNEVIREDGPLSPEAAAAVFEQVLNALQIAHVHGAVHCGIRPSNIMVADNGAVKLLNLGVSRQNGNKPECLVPVESDYAYLAPEQVRGEDANYLSDIFSVGVTIHEALTGTNPFTDSDVSGELKVNLAGVAKIADTLPAPIRDMLQKSLAREPHQRYQSAREFHSIVVNDMRDASGVGPFPETMSKRHWQRYKSGGDEDYTGKMGGSTQAKVRRVRRTINLEWMQTALAGLGGIAMLVGIGYAANSLLAGRIQTTDYRSESTHSTQSASSKLTERKVEPDNCSICRGNMQKVLNAECAYKEQNAKHRFTTNMDDLKSVSSDLPTCPDDGHYRVFLSDGSTPTSDGRKAPAGYLIIECSNSQHGSFIQNVDSK